MIVNLIIRLIREDRVSGGGGVGIGFWTEIGGFEGWIRGHIGNE